MPPASLTQAWRLWRAQWLARRRVRAERWTLDQKHVYIMPSRWGAATGLMMLTLLLVAINAQANVGYLLTFLLAASGISSMFQTHASLRGLVLDMPGLPMGFVGQTLPLTVQVHNPTDTDRAAVALAWHHHEASAQWLAVPRLSVVPVRLAWQPSQRGWQTVPTVRAWSVYPMGLFRAWAVWRPAQQVLVCPRPEPHAPAWPVQAGHGRRPHAQADVDAEAGHDVRPYRAGDPLKQVLWKKAAKTTPWLCREWPATATEVLWLRPSATGLQDTEAQLERLTAWVMQAHAQGLRYGLELDAHTRLAPQTGPAHRQACLQALALWRLPA